MRGLGIALMTAALVAMAGGETIAQRPAPGPPPKPSPQSNPVDRIGEVLGLTDAQKAAWDAAAKTMRATGPPLYVKARVTQREIDAPFKQGTPDAAVLEEKPSA